MGIAQCRITVVLPALHSRQQRDTAALETSSLSQLPIKAECLEWRMVLQLDTGLVEVYNCLPSFTCVILKVT